MNERGRRVNDDLSRCADGRYKTFTDWGLKLESINISFPEAKTDQVDIPGANGLLDLSGVNGQICYKNRTLTLNFSCLTITRNGMI